MDTRPIGVFDSGLGGLTAVRQLRRVLPGEDIVYFGDTGRVALRQPRAGHHCPVRAAGHPLFIAAGREIYHCRLRHGVLDLSAGGGRQAARAVYRRCRCHGPRGGGRDAEPQNRHHRHSSHGAQRIVCRHHPRHDARRADFCPRLPDVCAAGRERLLQRRQPGHKADHCGVSAGAEGRGR